jgi:DNA-binding response OmpR family regulator
MRLLLVEDDDLLGAAVQKGLTRLGYAVDWIRKGNDLAVALHTHEYHGVLLDLGLPDACGKTLLKYVKAHKPGVPVVVTTARGAVADRVGVLDLGADDYMVKPIDLDELGARLRAVTRRASAPKNVVQALEHGALKLVPANRAVTWQGEPVQLTQKEYLVLEFFLRKKHQVVTRAQLEAALYADGGEIGSNTVEVYVHYLRRKLSNSLIQTVRGVGYQLGEVTRFDA